MYCMLVMVSSLFLKCIQTENITLKPGDEKLYSIFTGDTLTLQCPVNQIKKSDVRWTYMKNNEESILSVGEQINKNPTNFQFRVNFTNHLKNVTFLRIYNITSKEQRIYRCYYKIDVGNTAVFVYNYNIQLANITQSLVRNPNGTLCCELHGQNTSATNFIWEQRTLYDEHIRFIESGHQINSGTLERQTDEAINKQNHMVSCLNLNTKRGVKNYQEGKYICLAQVFIYNRSQTVNKTTSIKIENIQDEPFCIHETKRQHSNLGTNVRIVMNFYSKPNYSALSIKRNDSKLKVTDMFTVFIKNISLNIYNATVVVSGYEILINITKFSEDDIGNYTVNISNGFGSCNCTVQLLSQGNDFPENNHTKKVVIENKTRAEITKSLQWYILACGTIIVVLFAMLALRSTFIKTVDNCSNPTIRKPSCHKSTEKQATKKHSTKKQAARKPRRAYSDQFMEVTLNELNNGERLLIIGQTNEMDASTETNI